MDDGPGVDLGGGCRGAKVKVHYKDRPLRRNHKGSKDKICYIGSACYCVVRFLLVKIPPIDLPVSNVTHAFYFMDGAS